MATVNNPCKLNYFGLLYPTAVDYGAFPVIYALTRCLIKAGWKYKASGNSSKDTTALQVNDGWGSFSSATVTNAGAAYASITSVSRGRATVTGLSGIVAADKGRFLYISGSGSSNNGYFQIESILSASSVQIDARAATITAPDANNGSLTWEVHDVMLQTRTGLTTASWILLRGPSILKIPITAAPTVGSSGSAFVRGENIVQGTTGFEGEILGYVFDGVSTGYLVVSPRVRGTGAGVYGLTAGYVFTGAVSGSTVVQVGTALEYAREIIFWKKTADESYGNVMLGVFDVNNDTTYTSLAASTGCTSIVAPGGGGTNNTFPTYGWMALGGSTTGGTPYLWLTKGWNNFPFGSSSILCVDAIEEQGYSADGSWWCFAWDVAAAATDVAMIGYQRLENTEDGDVDPYVSVFPSYSSSVLLYSNNRLSSAVPVANGNYWSANGTVGAALIFCGWLGRGVSGWDMFQNFEHAFLMGSGTFVGSYWAAAQNISSSNTASTIPGSPLVKEPVWLVSLQQNRKCYKGTLKWAGLVVGGSVGMLLNSKKFIKVTFVTAGWVVGPWDGSTEPQIS